MATMGRPRIEFEEKDWQKIQELCQIQCTQKEISGVMQCSEDTVERRIREKYNLSFADYYKNHSDVGKMSLRRAMFKSALIKGNATMQIWLSKQHLGMRDNVTHELDLKDKKLNIYFTRAKDGKKDDTKTQDDKAGSN